MPTYADGQQYHRLVEESKEAEGNRGTGTGVGGGNGIKKASTDSIATNPFLFVLPFSKYLAAFMGTLCHTWIIDQIWSMASTHPAGR